MTSTRLAAIWMRARSQLRSRAGSWLAVAVLVGIAGGLVMAAAAGARRTNSVYDRLLAGAAPFDAVFVAGCAAEDPLGCDGRDAQRAINTALALPEARDGAAPVSALVPILTNDGTPIHPSGEVCYTGPGEVGVDGSADGRFGTEVNRYHYVAGRAANPRRADEVVLSEATARASSVAVGDRLHIVPVDACEDIPRAEWPAPIDVTVVGITLAPGMVQPSTGFYLQAVGVTPPLLARVVAQVPGTLYGAIRFADGVTVDEFSAAAQRAGIDVIPVLLREEMTAGVQASLGADTAALVLLAALGGLAALVVLGQALIHQVRADTDDHAALRAMGFTRRDLAAVGALQGAVVGAVGAALAVALAIAVSPLSPIGRARRIETSPGVSADTFVLGIGAIVVGATALVLVFIAAWWVARPASVRSTRRRARPSWVATVVGTVSRQAASPTLECGTGMAVDPGRGAHAAPMRSGLTGIIVGLAAVIGAATFAAGLGHLREKPRLVGLNWDSWLSYTPAENADEDADEGEIMQAFFAALARAERLDAVERVGYGTLYLQMQSDFIDGTAALPLSFSTGPRAVKPTVTAGRAPAGPDEIVLGRGVLRTLGLGIGDTVVVNGAPASEDTQEPSHHTLEIVGVGVLPVPDSDNGSAAVTTAGLERLFPEVTPDVGMVELAPGTDRAAAFRDLGALGFEPFREDTLPPLEELSIDVREADVVPRLLGGLMALLATAVLIHLVVTAARVRRRELATLRAIGFTPRQVRATVAWQATALVGASLIVAGIVGIVAGRAAWELYAKRLGVAPEAVSPWIPIALIALVALLVTNVVAYCVGLALTRRSAAATLRSE